MSLMTPSPRIRFDSISSHETFTRIKQVQQKNLQDIAIRRIGSDMLRTLSSIHRLDYIEARNKIDIPRGMFGLSLDSFYSRAKETDTVYIDILKVVCKATLEKAKTCIVLDDLYDFVRKIFAGYESKELEWILEELSDSQKLLKIKETIAMDFKKNSELLRKIKDRLSASNVREINAILYANSKVLGAQNGCVEAKFVLHPIEYRYSISFHNRKIEQSVEKIRQNEEKLEKNLDDVEISCKKENIVSDSIIIKQRMDIAMLKARINEMSELYDREYEFLDGQIAYKTNAIESMREQFKDCIAKLEFYKMDIERLRKWHKKGELKKAEDARADAALEKSKVKGKKKNEATKMKKKK